MRSWFAGRCRKRQPGKRAPLSPRACHFGGMAPVKTPEMDLESYAGTHLAYGSTQGARGACCRLVIRRIEMRFIVIALSAMLGAPGISASLPAEQNPAKAVLVTGASSGIGRKITERLAADGYFVYATARKDADLEALRAIKNVQPLRLDVTQSADIAAAVESVTKGGRGLYGLVNNAGIATWGTIADMTLEEFDLTMKVNAYGPLMM